MIANTEREPFVDAVEAAEFLRLRPRRVLELARRGVIPAYPLGDGQRRGGRGSAGPTCLAPPSAPGATPAAPGPTPTEQTKCPNSDSNTQDHAFLPAQAAG